MRLHEAVLSGLLRVGRRAGDHPRGAERDRLMQSHDLLIGVQLAALCARNELRFLWWPVLHRARTTTEAPDWFRAQGRLRGPCNYPSRNDSQNHLACWARGSIDRKRKPDSRPGSAKRPPQRPTASARRAARHGNAHAAGLPRPQSSGHHGPFAGKSPAHRPSRPLDRPQRDHYGPRTARVGGIQCHFHGLPSEHRTVRLQPDTRPNCAVGGSSSV
jgi:hypothetical protein